MNNLDQLKSWLNDAHSMEQGLIKVLENHAKDAKDHPDVRARDEQHIEETRRHVERVTRCLELLGEKPSAMKSAWSKMTGVVQGASSGPFRDEIVKNFLSDYAAEHLEIACYRSLIAAADELNQPEIAELCRQNLRDEEEMARWLEENIPVITRMYLQEQHAHA